MVASLVFWRCRGIRAFPSTRCYGSPLCTCRGQQEHIIGIGRHTMRRVCHTTSSPSPRWQRQVINDVTHHANIQQQPPRVALVPSTGHYPRISYAIHFSEMFFFSLLPRSKAITACWKRLVGSNMRWHEVNNIDEERHAIDLMRSWISWRICGRLLTRSTLPSCPMTLITSPVAAPTGCEPTLY